MILEVFFKDRVVLVRHILTHQEYDQRKWKTPSPLPERKAGQRGDSIEEERSKGNGEDKGRRSRK